MQKVLNSSLNLYYKCKRKILLNIDNTLGFLGLNRRIEYNDKIKVDVKTANSDELYVFGPLKEYLLLFRNDLGNLYKFINFLTEDEQEKISLLLMHFFYEDITVNESSDTLNYIYHTLLTNDLGKYCDSFYLDDFINPHSFTGKMTKQLIYRNEIKLYISHILFSLINDLEESCEKNNKINITLDLEFLENVLKKRKVLPGGDSSINSKKILAKTKTTFNSTIVPDLTKKSEDTSLSKRKNVFGVPEKKEKGIDILSKEQINRIFNEEYDYTEKTLKSFLKKVGDNNYKLIYLRQLKQINNTNSKNIFSIKSFKEKILNNIESRKLFSYYYENLKSIKTFISSIIFNINNFKDSEPKLIKTAYKAIYNFFHVNYQNINAFDMNIFLINYLFEYIILPTLRCPEINESLNKEKIFNYKTHKDLQPIINILRHVAQCRFFIEDDYKMLNTFIVEQHYLLQNYFTEMIMGIEKQIYFDQKRSENIFENENYLTMCLSREELKIFINHYKEMEFQDEKGELDQMIRDSVRVTEDNRSDKFSTFQYFVFININYDG